MKHKRIRIGDKFKWREGSNGRVVDRPIYNVKNITWDGVVIFEWFDIHTGDLKSVDYGPCEEVLGLLNNNECLLFESAYVVKKRIPKFVL